MRVSRKLAALALGIGIALFQFAPLLATADSMATTTAASRQSSTGSATSTTTTVASSSSDMTLSATTTAQRAATSTNDLSLKASSTNPSLLAGSSVSSIIAGTASSTEHGSAGTAASSAPAVAATSSATTTADIPVSIGSAEAASTSIPTSTPPIASSTQTIRTGNALALANVLNLLNASFINSQGSILFANFASSTGSIDLRIPSLFSGLCGAAPCSNLSGLAVNILNQANLTNNISVLAQSGNNDISNASSSAAIKTGSTFAGLNLVNLANVTLLGSNYLLVTLNAFRDVNGDIVFPSLTNFFNAQPSALASGSATSTNAASVANAVGATADSGGDTITNAGDSVIATGNSNAFVNVVNQLNSLLVGSGLSVLVRVGGLWNGEVQGVPSNVSVATSSDGVLISGTAVGTSTPLNGLSLNASSTALITNDASSTARSGGNTIENASSTAGIATGDSYAAANVINVANQTIIGRNWLLAIVNIFGDFNGNIDFGQPNLWVGESVSVPTYVENGSVARYTVTVTNRGDADAHQVQLVATFDAAHLAVATSSAYALDGNTLHFALGDLSRGQSVQVSYSAIVRASAPGTVITNHATATAHESDSNIADNTDSVSIVTSMPSGGGGPVLPIVKPVPDTATSSTALATTTLSVQRVTDLEHAVPGQSVEQRIVITNTSTIAARNVSLIDVLKDPSGLATHEEEFAIGDVNPGDEVVISYELSFGSSAQPGTYALASQVSGDNIPSGGAVNGSVTLAPPPIVLAAPIIPVASTSSLRPHLARITVSRINQIVQEASSTAPVNMTQKRELLAAANTAAPDPGPWFASFYVLVVGSLAAVAKKALHLFI